jgi:hypothetical protein
VTPNTNTVNQVLFKAIFYDSSVINWFTMNYLHNRAFYINMKQHAISGLSQEIFAMMRFFQTLQLLNMEEKEIIWGGELGTVTHMYIMIVLYFTGKYCGSEGLPDVTGPCDPGYYCPAGQVSATPANYSCQPGYFCVGGKSAPEPCPSGSYQVRNLIISPRALSLRLIPGKESNH